MKPLFVTIALLIGLGIAWYVTGGPERAISHGGPLLQAPPPLGGGGAYSVPGVSYGNYGTATSTSSSNTTTWGTFTNYLGTFTEDKSPYAKYVTLDRAHADSTNGEYVTVRVSRSAPATIVMSDWKLESTETLAKVSLGNASALPYAGQVNGEQTLALPPGATVYVVTGQSPIGVSFRTNQCTGYFGQFQTFTPSLPSECPRPLDEAERVLNANAYTQACENYVRTIDECNNTLNAIPPGVGIECQNFIQNTLTYNGCVAAHKNEPEFYKNEWYIFLKRDQELWKNRGERIRLIDENGKVVSVVSY
jgi:hypothetical protein